MAIKFGDTLENQNSDFPIVDLTGGHAAGIVFHTTFNNTDLGNIPLNKRKDGMLVVDKTSGKIYVWKGGDGIANGSGFNDITDSDWAVIGSTPVVTANLDVQLPAGASFGRFANGDQITVNADGTNALQIIQDAITGFVTPQGTITSSASTFAFSEVARPNESHTLTFTVKNMNQNSVAGTGAGDAFAIRTINIQRRQGSASFTTIQSIATGSTAYGTFNNLNANGTPTNVSFSYPDNDVDIDASEGSVAGNYDYRISVVANDSAGSATSAVTVDEESDQVSITDYAQPTSSDTITRNSSYSAPTGFKTAGGSQNLTFSGTGNNSSNANIVVGDNNLGANFTVTRNSPLVDMVSYTAFRVVDGAETQIQHSDSNVTVVGTASAASFTVAITDNQSASARETVKYRLKVVDQEQTTTLDSPTFTYLHLGYLGFNTKDNLPTVAAAAAGVVAATGGNNASLGEAGIEALSVRKIAASLSTVHQFTGATTQRIALNASSNEFLFIAYPDTSDLLTTFQADGASPTLNADVACTEANSNTAFSEAFTNSNISVTNVGGLTQNYLIYRSVSPTAFDGSVVYAIK
jgi:hypothetical protein